MRIPPFLTAGDSVAVVAPGGKVTPEKVQAAIATIRGWGLNVHEGQGLFATTHAYLAGTDEARFADLQEALNNPDIKAVFCARGGYGTTRILDQLDFTVCLTHPRWVIGYSDITALHLALYHQGIVSVHGTMPHLFNRTDSTSSVASLKQLLYGAKAPIQATPNAANRNGTVTGPLVGGSLSLLTDSLGTRYEVETAGKILLVEEVEEPDYRLDRMLMQLKRAGKFTHLAGLAIGYITRLTNERTPFQETVEDIVLDKVKEFDFPVAFGFPVGHEEPNIAFCHGGIYTLTVSAAGAVLRPEG